MKKKFKIRVVHFYQQYYIIQYLYYRFIPIWNTINEYIDLVPTVLSCYNPILHEYDNAIKFAKKFKSIEDVRQFNTYEHNKKIISDMKRNEWIKNNTPVYDKIIYDKK